jgi:hypothetical protein
VFLEKYSQGTLGVKVGNNTVSKSKLYVPLTPKRPTDPTGDNPDLDNIA